MHLKQLVATMALATFALTGCNAGPQANSVLNVSEEATATVTPTPTPTVMSNEEAGKVYLAAICPSNKQSDKTTAVVQAKPLDLQAAKAEAAALRDAFRTAIESLTDEKVLWPDSVKADVATVAEEMYAEVSGAGNLANQTTDANFIAAWNGWAQPVELATAAQKVRLKLGLSPDTSSSCAT